MSDEGDCDSEDTDYVPSVGGSVSEEEDSGDEEDLAALDEDDNGVLPLPSRASNKSILRKQKSNVSSRKRAGGMRLGDCNSDNIPGENGDVSDAAHPSDSTKLLLDDNSEIIEKERKQSDDLWAAFLSDVKLPKASATTPDHSTCSKQTSSATTERCNMLSAANDSHAACEKVTITKSFSGEEVLATEDVVLSCVKGEACLDEHEKVQIPEKVGVFKMPMPLPSSTAQSVKKPGTSSAGLSRVLDTIGKKRKIGTLDKSKLDWEAFKEREGIDEDLKIHNKGRDGYIERIAFLDRTDTRQFEIERNLRLKSNIKR